MAWKSPYPQRRPSARLLLQKLRWKIVPVTPRCIRRMLERVGFKPSNKSYPWLGTWGKHLKASLFKHIEPYQKVRRVKSGRFSTFSLAVICYVPRLAMSVSPPRAMEQCVMTCFLIVLFLTLDQPLSRLFSTGEKGQHVEESVTYAGSVHAS